VERAAKRERRVSQSYISTPPGQWAKGELSVDLRALFTFREKAQDIHLIIQQ
jgi:hypothetical protein